MNRIQENKDTMASVVLEYMKELPETLVQDTPGLEENIQELTEILEVISEKNENQNTDNTGYSIVKTNLRNSMVQLGVNIAYSLKAYAKRVNNEVLFTEMSMTKSVLDGMRDNDVKDKCQLIATRATTHVASITTYGITQAVIDGYTQNITQFGNYIPKPRLSITANVLLTQNIAVAFKALDKCLEELDIKMFALNFAHNQVVEQYKSCRRIVNHAGRLLSLVGNITDQNYSPVFGAVISIPAINREAKSTKKGNFEFKNLPEGQYMVQIARPSFATQTVMVGVVKGETTELKIMLLPANENLRVA